MRTILASLLSRFDALAAPTPGEAEAAPGFGDALQALLSESGVGAAPAAVEGESSESTVLEAEAPALEAETDAASDVEADAALEVVGPEVEEVPAEDLEPVDQSLGRIEADAPDEALVEVRPARTRMPDVEAERPLRLSAQTAPPPPAALEGVPRSPSTPEGASRRSAPEATRPAPGAEPQAAAPTPRLESAEASPEPLASPSALSRLGAGTGAATNAPSRTPDEAATDPPEPAARAVRPELAPEAADDSGPPARVAPHAPSRAFEGDGPDVPSRPTTEAPSTSGPRAAHAARPSDATPPPEVSVPDRPDAAPRTLADLEVDAAVEGERSRHHASAEPVRRTLRDLEGAPQRPAAGDLEAEPSAPERPAPNRARPAVQRADAPLTTAATSQVAVLATSSALLGTGLEAKGPAPASTDGPTTDPVPAVSDAPASTLSSQESAPAPPTRVRSPLPARLAAPAWIDRVPGAGQEVRVSLGEDGAVRLQTVQDADGVTVSVRFSDPELQALAAAHAPRLRELLESHFEGAVRLSLDSAGPDADAQGHARDGAASRSPRPGPARTTEPTAAPRPETAAVQTGREWIG